MRVLRTQIGFVSTWVVAPARPDEMKKSTGVRRLGASAPEPEPCFRATIPRSILDLKKKKDAQLVALPTRFGVRPR